MIFILWFGFNKLKGEDEEEDYGRQTYY